MYSEKNMVRSHSQIKMFKREILDVWSKHPFYLRCYLYLFIFILFLILFGTIYLWDVESCDFYFVWLGY